MDKILDFDQIFYGKSSGKIKFASSGIAFKDSNTLQVLTIQAEEFQKLSFLRAARDYQLQISTPSTIYKFDGFPRQANETLKDFCSTNYPVQLDFVEVSLKGFNWGSSQVTTTQFEFLVQDQLAFQIPLNQITSSVVAAKNELAIEMQQGERKIDSLVEMRFFIPDDQEDEDLAASISEQIKESADLGQVTGQIIVSFTDLPCLTPRGRYEVDMTSNYMRFRGKTYDYKIPYTNINRLFLLPKPDDVHVLFVLALEAPIRQGQTRYPFMIMQFATDEILDIELEPTVEELKEKYGDKLQKEYSAPTFEVVSSIFKTLTDKKIIVSGSFKTKAGDNSMKCSMKTNEGFLFPLDKSLLFIPKNPIWMNHADISHVVFSRVGKSTGSRTFDMKVSMKNTNEFQFSNLSKEDFPTLDEYLKERGIKCSNEVALDEPIQKTISSDNEEKVAGGSEEESSEDEDYDEDQESGSASDFSGSEAETAESEQGDDE